MFLDFLRKNLKKPQNHGVGRAKPGFVVVFPRHWALALVFAGLALLTLGYLFFGEIPITAKGDGMFLVPGTVIPFQAKAGGMIRKWHVTVGESVVKGQLLATLDQPVIEEQLALAKQKLNDVEAKNKSLEMFVRTYIEMEKAAGVRKGAMIRERVAVLQQEIAKDKAIVEKVYKRKMAYLGRHETDLRQVRDLSKQRETESSRKLELTRQLRQQSLRSEDQLLTVKQEKINHRDRVNQLGLQLIQIGLDKIKFEESILQTLNRIADAEASVEDLEQLAEELTSKSAQLEEQLATTIYSMKMEASELVRAMDRFVRELADNREIHSEYDGVILELTAGPGKLINKGDSLGRVDTRMAQDILGAVAYFKLAEGKKIKPGMKIRLTPATVQRERYGSIIARVASVSSYPVTTEKVIRVTGNPELAAFFTRDEKQIEVYAELLRDAGSVSGYQWDLSAGPVTEVTAGSLASAMVNIEERTPISFVIPLLRKGGGP
ncbi:MAG: NHLP bacteriocin system secretion protein [Deltaproteobacteria bacterium]|nr:NHLP bacteriocin system secretion protein [Deltaproteobacteria bacterium]